MEKVWLKHYQEGIPEEINPEAYQSVVEMFDQACKKFANRPAFYNMGNQITFSELDQQSRAFAAYLQSELKLKKEDRVGIMLPNLLQFPIVMFGILRAGMIVVNINPLFTPRELEDQLKDSGAKALIVLENFAHVVAETHGRTSVEHYFITKLSDTYAFPKSILVNLVVKHVKKMVPKWYIPNTIDYKEALSKGQNLEFTPVTLGPGDIAFLQYTGGTTGRSKGAMLTHRNIIGNLEQGNAWVGTNVNDNNEIIITALPLYHIFSLLANCLLFIRYGALNILITNPRDLDTFIKEITKFKFTVITGVNTLFNALLHHPKIGSVDFSRLHLTLGGGMAVQGPVAEKWQKLTNKPLLEAYGLTETSPAVCMNPLNLSAFNGTIGLPIPSTEIKVINDNDSEVGFDIPGELCVRGPQVMLGYWQRPDETKHVLSEDGWLKTGDIATIDQEGFVRIVDRKKDMILVSGFNVYPNQVEDIIAELDGVLEVAVIGVKSGASGEAVKAFIVRQDSTLTTEQVIEHCRKNLTAYKVPKEVEFCQDLPKTNVGKILRRALREAN